MSFLRNFSRASKGATCAIAMAALAMSSANAQVTNVIVNDSFADGITDSGALTAAGTPQLNWSTTSSTAGLDIAQAPGPVDFASGDSGRGVHAIFPTQTLAAFGDVLTVTFQYTTPDTISFDGGTNGVTGSGSQSTNEDFRWGLFDTGPAQGILDPNLDPTGMTPPAPVDFLGPINANSSSPNPVLEPIPGIVGEIDNINASGTDLGIRTHNVNSDLNHGFPSGRLFGTTNGFDFIAGGDDDVITLLPNSDYIATTSIEFTDATLTSLEVTLGMEALDGSFNDSFTRTVFIDDTTVVTDIIDPVTGMVTGTNSNREIGANTTTFDMLALGVTTGAFGGTVGPTPGSSTVGEANNGIDISNVTITYFDADGVVMNPVIKGDVNMSGELIATATELLASQISQYSSLFCKVARTISSIQFLSSHRKFFSHLRA